MTTRFLNSLMFSAAIVCSIGSVSEAANMNYLGGWSNAVIYKPGSVVVYNSGIYYSLKSTKPAPNRNYITSTNPSWWQQVGTVGNTILSGPGNPFDQSLGQAGDFYLNTTTSTLFGPKTAIAPYWPAEGVALAGSGGEAGPQGPTGPAGAAGATGPQGPAGVAGADGAIGLQGPAGVAGPAGPQGPGGAIGPQGPAGAVGPAGVAGTAGAAGTAGPTGPIHPGGTVYDSNGVIVGYLLDNAANTGAATIVMDFGGNYYRVPVTYTGFSDMDLYGSPQIEVWSDLDCTGTKYMRASRFPPAAAVFPNNVPDEISASTNVRIAYPAYPIGFVNHLSMKTSQNSSCQNSRSRSLAGVWTEMKVDNYVAPFSLK